MEPSTRDEAMCLCASRRLVIHFLDAVTIIFIVGLQGSLLNYCLIKYYEGSTGPYFYFLGDMFTMVVFAGTLTTSYNYLTKKQAIEDQSHLSPPAHLIQEIETNLPWSSKKVGVMPFSYISWIVYITILISKVIIIYKAPDLIKHLTDKDYLIGPNILKVTIALTSLVFLSLAEGHNWSKRGSARYSLVTSTCAKNGIEIFDAVTFLALQMEEKVEEDDGFKEVILYLSIVPFFLPALSLFELSLKDVSSEKVNLILTIVQDVLRLTLVDLPFLAVRVYLWVFYDDNASLFLMKNVLCILLVSRTLCPDIKALANHLKYSQVPTRHHDAAKMDEEERYTVHEIEIVAE